jgi:hypothetical protein
VRSTSLQPLSIRETCPCSPHGPGRARARESPLYPTVRYHRALLCYRASTMRVSLITRSALGTLFVVSAALAVDDTPPREAPDAGTAPSPPAEVSKPSFWPSLLVEPGVGVVAAPKIAGAGTFGFGLGVAMVGTPPSGGRIPYLAALHVDYTFAPRVNRADATLTVGTGIADVWAVSVRAGPTLDTLGSFGVRAGVRAGIYHVLNLELMTQHTFAPAGGLGAQTSGFLVLSADLVPIAAVLLLAKIVDGIFH